MCDPSLTCVIPERFRSELLMIKRYTNRHFTFRCGHCEDVFVSAPNEASVAFTRGRQQCIAYTFIAKRRLTALQV